MEILLDFTKSCNLILIWINKEKDKEKRKPPHQIYQEINNPTFLNAAGQTLNVLLSWGQMFDLIGAKSTKYFSPCRLYQVDFC